MGRPNRYGVRGLRRSKDGRYRFDYRYTDGKGVRQRVQKTFDEGISADAAKHKARALLERLNKSSESPREDPKLHAVMDAYGSSPEVKDLKSARTVHSRIRSLKRFLPNRRVSQLTPADIDRFKRKYKEHGASPATINRALATWSRIVRYARRHDLLSMDLAERLRDSRRCREPEGRVRWLTHREERALMGVLSGVLLELVTVALATGMRQGEILALRGRHLRQGRRVEVETSKSNRRRVVPCSKEAFDMLLRRKRSLDRLLFVRDDGQALDGTWVSKAFRRACAKAQIEDFTFHDLRHTFATRARSADKSLPDIAELLGHSSLDMTRRYAHSPAHEVVGLHLVSDEQG